MPVEKMSIFSKYFYKNVDFILDIILILIGKERVCAQAIV